MVELPPGDWEAISTRVKISKEGEADEFIHLSKQFRDADADITIISNDNIHFYLHKKNLALNTGGFPPLEFGSPQVDEQREEATLSERGYILHLLFQFAYPQPNPDLDTLEIGVLSELAEAADKYEVYNAMSVCNAMMKYGKLDDLVE